MSLWKDDGIIDDSQAKAIMLRYSKGRENEELLRGGRLVTLLAVMGALLLGVGVILFFAANWQVMPKWLKVGIVLGSILVAYGTGYWLAFEKANYPRVGRAVIFLGTVLYGSGIWLIAQIFHINAHYPNGVLFWVLGIIPVVIICRSLSVLIEASLLLTLWTVLEQTGFQTTNLLYLPLFFLILWISYNMKSRVAAGLALLGMTVWMAIAGVLSLKETESFIFALLLTSLLGLLYYISGNLHSLKENLAYMKLPYQFTGLAVFFVSLFLLSFRFLVNVSGISFISGLGFPRFFIIALSVLIALTAASGIYILKRSGYGRESVKETVVGFLGAFILTVTVFLAGIVGTAGFTAMVNILLFAAIMAVVLIGYSNREPVMINIGIVFFVLDVIARYFDFFWDMLPKSLFFMAGGLLLLVGGTLLERNRRKIIRELKVTHYEA